MPDKYISLSGSQLVPLAERFNPKEKYTEIQTGFKGIDSIIGGLRSGGAYLIGGGNKSGKSSLLMNILNHRLKSGMKVGLINTELTDQDVINRMAGIWLDKDTEEVEKNPKLAKDWLEVNSSNFLYAGIKDLSRGNELNFDIAMKHAKDFALSGCKLICLDNLSTFSTSLIQGKQGWEVLNNCLTKLINFSKENDVITIPVLHTKKGGTYKENPEGIKNLVKEGSIDKLFSDSITVVTKPSIDDVHGGIALSQLTGAILVWRPLQFYNDSQLSKQSQIILEQFRYCADGGVKMDYVGEKKIFHEVGESESFENYIKNYKDEL